MLVFEGTIIRINVKLIFINNRFDPDPDLMSGLLFYYSNILLLKHYINSISYFQKRQIKLFFFLMWKELK